MQNGSFLQLLLCLFFSLCYGQVASIKASDSDNSFRWKFSASYLLWQNIVEGLDMAADNLYVDYFPPPNRGRTYGVSFPLRSGFQITLGANLPNCDGVQFQAVYSWLSPLSKENISYDPVVQTFPFYSVKPFETVPNSDIFVIEHQATFQSYYNLLDLFIQRESAIAPSFMISPLMGLRGTWQKQKWYTDLLMFTLNPVVSNYQYNYTQNFGGAGPILGGYLRFFPFRNFSFLKSVSFFGKMAASGILGNIQVSSIFSASSPNSNPTYSSNKKNVFSIVPVWDLSIGLYFEKELEIQNSFYEIYLKALWDTQAWIGFNKMQSSLKFFSTPYSMTVQGLTIELGLLF
jgi:hypothetical protein